MKSADDIERYFQKATLSTNVDRHETIYEKIQRAQDQSKTTAPALSGFNLRSKIMKNHITKLAAAAAVIAVVGLGILEFIGTGSKSGVVWAEVVRKVEASRGVIYRTRGTGNRDPNDDWPQAYRMHYRSPLHSQLDWYRGGQIRRTVHFDLSTKTSVWLAYDENVYARQPMQEEAVQSVQGEWMRPEDITNRIVGHEYRELGSRTIDGVLCDGIETTDPAVFGDRPGFVARMWVSVETGYPVLAEIESPAGPGGSARKTGLIDKFQWDVQFSPGDRQISIPSGFRPLE